MAVHFTGPVLNKEKVDGPRGWFSNMPMQGDPSFVTYFNDFLMAQDYAAADWTITTTEAGSGSATEALLADERSGALKILNDDASGDSDVLQATIANYKLSAGKRLWFECKAKWSDPTLVDGLIALNIVDATPLATTEGVQFHITNGAATIDTKTIAASTATTTSAVATAVADTYNTYGLAWDGKNRIDFYIDRSLVATHTANITSSIMVPTLEVKNGSAVAQSLIVDYIYICQER